MKISIYILFVFVMSILSSCEIVIVNDNDTNDSPFSFFVKGLAKKIKKAAHKPIDLKENVQYNLSLDSIVKVSILDGRINKMIYKIDKSDYKKLLNYKSNNIEIKEILLESNTLIICKMTDMSHINFINTEKIKRRSCCEPYYF